MRTDTSPRARRPRPLAAAAAALVLVAGPAACGDDDPDDLGADIADTQDTTVSESDAPATTSGGDDAATDGADAEADADAGGEGPTVIAEDFTFDAPPVPAGTEVTFRNEDSAPHTVTADDGAFDSGSVDAGGSATFVAPSEPGDYAFHCEIHPEMQATLTVEA